MMVISFGSDLMFLWWIFINLRGVLEFLLFIVVCVVLINEDLFMFWVFYNSVLLVGKLFVNWWVFLSKRL